MFPRHENETHTLRQIVSLNGDICLLHDTAIEKFVATRETGIVLTKFWGFVAHNPWSWSGVYTVILSALTLSYRLYHLHFLEEKRKVRSNEDPIHFRLKPGEERMAKARENGGEKRRLSTGRSGKIEDNRLHRPWNEFME